MNSVGQPLKFPSVEALQLRIEAYFRETPKEEWTITGLACWLGTNRQTLMNYSEKPEYVDTIKGAKNKIEAEYERRGWAGKATPFAIFALKNFDWSDKGDSEHGFPSGMAPQVMMVDFTTYLKTKNGQQLQGEGRDS